MAIVYLARELATGQIVAIKLLGALQGGSTEAARRFAREAETVSALEHPNIVRVLRVEDLDGPAPAIISVYIPGETLRDLLRRGPLPYERATQILREIASALAYAHDRRIVHRDVKPENIVLELHTGRALLADFGVARQLDAETILTVVGTSVGTPAYMAPEQIIGSHVDARADVYALGLIGWEMLSGRRPWEGETLYGVLHKQQHEKLPPLDELRPDIPTYLLRAIAGAMEKDPECRWRDASEFLERLNPSPAALPPLPVRGDLDGPSADVGPIFVPDAVVPVVSPTAAEEPEVVPVPVAASTVAPPPPLAEVAPVTPTAPVTPVTPVTPVPPVPPVPPVAPVTPPPSAPHPAFVTAERRQPRAARRRWWPAAAAVVALLLVAVLLSTTRHAKARPVSGDRGLDSLLNAAGADGVVLVDSANRAATEKKLTTAQRKKARTDSIARARSGNRVEAAGTVDLAPPAGSDRCRSTASADQRACLMSAIARNDAPLNRAYQALITDLRGRLSGDAEAQAVERLREEQRAWLDKRDRECRAATPEGSTGLWGVARAPCFAQRSAQRTTELRARVGH
ncbi:protein kinase [Gemmatirosa kalamazoonensis]|uniref:Protein kinase n=2 Tax=Gemmatirosa kalamazoonensis TaxID=861299 RepID=W0RLG6_9BACT|nr:protein kinase [Gemmatirosa kalamazoonensis]